MLESISTGNAIGLEIAITLHLLLLLKILFCAELNEIFLQCCSVEDNNLVLRKH